MTGTNGPALIDVDINYHPSISFDGVNDNLILSGGILGTDSYTDLSVIFINKTNKVKNSFIFYEALDSGERFGSHVPWGNNRVYYDLGRCCGTSRIQTNWGTSINDYHLWTLGSSTSTTTPTGTRKSIHRDGQEIVSNNQNDSGVGKGSNFNLGSTGSNYFHSGNIAEFIILGSTPSAGELQQIHTYLAIKYGITLRADNNNNSTSFESPNTDGIHEGDYLNTQGSIVWDASDNQDYQNDIIGLARDDDTALEQKQSQTMDDSTKIYIHSLVYQNTLNAGTITNDLEYLLIGHNSENLSPTTQSNAEKPAELYSRIAREWKITNTNFNSDFNLELQLNDLTDFGSTNPSDFRLLVDSNTDFTDATIYSDLDGILFSIDNGMITINDISLAQVSKNATSFFTIGTVAESPSLPIELMDFSAELKEDKVELRWQTSAEINNDYFTIERLIADNNWEIIATQSGAGNSTDILYYLDYDNQPLQGLNYYRLKQTDFDGNFSYSDIVSVNISNQDTKSVKIYPNPVPVNRSLNVLLTMNGDNPNMVIKIFDGLGRVVQQTHNNVRKGYNAIILHLEGLTSGSYYVHFSGLDNEEVIKPLIIAGE